MLYNIINCSFIFHSYYLFYQINYRMSKIIRKVISTPAAPKAIGPYR